MAADLFGKIRSTALARLKKLSPSLYYHSLGHTLDVLEQCSRIAETEGVTDPHQLFLLKVAALYHDTGFLNTYKDHEKAGCGIFLEDCRFFAISEEDKKLVVELIMVTQLPQTPSNLLEKIICDADLDYLGRDDFFEIADHLRKEFLWYKIVTDNETWEKLQFRFLMQHAYHTESSRNLREPVKQQHISRIREDQVAE